MNNQHLETANIGTRLQQLGEDVQKHILSGRDLANDSHPTGFYGGDTIYQIDRRVESTITSALEAWPESFKPLLIVAEGFGDDGRKLVGPRHQPLRYRVLIDPIDGTRGLMYDKRSAWFLAAVAPDRGEETRLSHSIASSMVELPTSKQTLADSFCWMKGGDVVATRTRLDTGKWERINIHPSSEKTLAHGFGHVSNFFPGIKRLAADLMERIAEALSPSCNPGEATIFDDQYISTGGQFVELMCGRDRFTCDLRPLFYDILRRQDGKTTIPGLVCHAYDIAGLLVAQRSGVILTDGYGCALDAPFDIYHPVHWCGYANKALQESIEPVIQEWLRSKLEGRGS